MNSRIDLLEKDLESLQQYGRRNSLRFHNVPMNSDNIQGTDAGTDSGARAPPKIGKNMIFLA